MEETTLNQVPTTNTAVPAGIKIIAVLSYLFSISLIAFGAILAFVGLTFSTLLAALGFGYASSLGILPGVLMIALGALHFIVGRGLWKGKEWGRILALTMVGSNVVVGIINFMASGGTNYFAYITPVFYVVVAFYLFFNKRVKDSFSHDASKNISVTLSVFFILIYGAISGISFWNAMQTREIMEGLANNEPILGVEKDNRSSTDVYDAVKDAGTDAEVKRNMQKATFAAEEYAYEHNDVYSSAGTSVCLDPEVVAALMAASVSGTGGINSYTCNVSVDGKAWAASTPLKTGGYWCVDGTLKQKPISIELGSATFLCPQQQ